MVPRSGPSSAEIPETAEREVQLVAAGAPASENPGVISIRAERISPELYVEQIMVRGRTQAFRHVQVRAELPGRLVSEPVPRGARVSAGDVLCELAIDDRSANLNEALAQRERAQFEYDAAVDLQARDLQSDVVVAQLKAALESAEAAVTRAQLAVDRTQIVAPFDGVVEQRSVEVGDLLNVGSVCASVLDDSPMLLVGLIPEQEVNRIRTGAEVSGRLLGGPQVTGTVTFLAASADPVSRSYRIEIEVDSPDRLTDWDLSDADIIMFDNMSMTDLHNAINHVNQSEYQPLKEVSGNISLNTISCYRGIDIDRISVGSLTHSVKALDLSLIVK